MQKRRNGVKVRTTLLLALPDEHQLRFSKYKTAQELWAAILKTFSGNEATKKTKKNLLKQQYGNFKAEGKEMLEQTFNRLQAIISQLEFIDRNMSDLDTMSLDDLYNHLKVYESEVQKKSESNSQNMAFISSSKHNSGNEEANSTSVSTASANVSPTSTNIEIDEDDIEEMDIKWNMALLSMRANRFWKKTGKKISIQGTDVAGFDKSKVECFNYHKMGHFARECRTPRSQDKGRRDNYRQGSKVEGRLVEFKNQEIKFCEKIRVLEFNIEGKTNRIEYLTKELENLKNEKEGLESKLTGFQSASKYLDSLLENQRLDKNKEGPSPAIESTSDDAQIRNPSVPEIEASPSTILSKPFIKFVKAADPSTVAKLDKKETVREPSIKYAEQYRKPSKTSNVRGNQRNWNNLKSQQLGENFLMKNKACFNCGHFDYLSYDCSLRVKRGRTCPTNTHKSTSPRTAIHKTHRP
nr:hypothetical protein [Tanacetum cinerariifolium]